MLLLHNLKFEIIILKFEISSVHILFPNECVFQQLENSEINWFYFFIFLV